MASKSSRSGIVFILMSIFFRVIVNTKIQPLPSDISLIYGEYNNHKLYCKFETMQVIQKSEGLVEPVCFEKFKDMTQTLPDGNVTHPYLKYGAVKGYVPECEKLNVENGDVGTCYPGLKIPLVHTVCNYSCDPGFIATSLTVTCRLMGSQKNVSVQWWKDNDYFDPEKKESEYCKQLSIRNGKVGVCLKDSKHDLPHMFCNYSCDPGFLATNSNGNFHFELGNKYSFQRIKDEDLCIIKEPAVEPLVQEPENFTIPMAVLFPSLLTLIAIAVIIALPCTRRKMKAIFSGTEASSRPSCIQKENNETESTSLDIESHEQHTGDPCPTDGMAANDQTERHTQWKDSSPEGW
ncbi:unnamed protein product [Lymnaea stagnalis]|uniref:Ig-like domain-containing protein n=1 Tax=Lymnaea stagnalis TaxID=6523 RepID=A0AAV2IJY9_LYMST